jgi:hypothetical protein
MKRLTRDLAIAVAGPIIGAILVYAAAMAWPAGVPLAG